MDRRCFSWVVVFLITVSVPGPALGIEPGAPDENEARRPDSTSGFGREGTRSVSIEAREHRNASLPPEGRMPERIDAALSRPGDGRADPGEVAGGALTKLSGPLVAGGDVQLFDVTPNGLAAAYAATQDDAAIAEAYSVPVGGGGPIKLSAMPSGFCDSAPSVSCTPPSDPANCGAGTPACSAPAGVTAIQLSDTRAVYQADQDTLGVTDLYSVPIGGGPIVKLNQVPVTASGITPDGLTVAYFGQTPGGNVELYSVPIGGGASVQLSKAAINPNGNVTGADFSPDSLRMYYFADGDPANDDVFNVYSVSISGPPGSAIRLNAPVNTNVSGADFSPDSSRVVYTGDQDTSGVIELYSVSVLGPTGSGVKLNGPFPTYSDIWSFRISPDSSMVVYRADVTANGEIEVFSRSIDGSSAVNTISGPMIPAGDAHTLNVSNDSLWAVYGGDQDLDEADELYSRRIDGSGSRITLQANSSSGDGVGNFGPLGTPVIRGRAIYPLFFSGLADIYSVPSDGSQSAVKLSDPLPTGASLFSAYLPNYDDPDIMAYSGEQNTLGVTDGFTVPISGSLPPRQFNGTLVAGGNVGAFVIVSTEHHVVYIADQDTDETFELYSRVLDTDGDGAVNSGDNCSLIPNPGQLPVVFGQTIRAESPTTFFWANRTDTKYVRGPLDMVENYVTNDTGSLLEADSHIDTSDPSAGTGWYYAFAPDCPGGSYQTTLGAEPGRSVLP